MYNKVKKNHCEVNQLELKWQSAHSWQARQTSNAHAKGYANNDFVHTGEKPSLV